MIQPSKSCEVCAGTFVKRPRQSWDDWRVQRTCGPSCRNRLPHPWRNQRGNLSRPYGG